ncbi:MAG: LCP family protein [Acutalibacteraceae bacterium]|nr:LCP family protein [Acutalibacteraceae bacterium]
MSKNHKFNTAKQEKRKSFFRLTAIFICIAVVIGSVSVAVILKNNNNFIKDLFTNETTVQSQEESTAENDLVDLEQELTGRARVLLYCTDREASEIYFMAMVDANMKRQSFKVYPLKTDNPDYTKALSTGGYKELISKVESAEGIKIDRYIASDTDTFALAINYMGGLEYTVDERIEYRTDDYTLILTKGDQTIKGETLLKYFRYCKTLDAQTGLQQQGDLICAMIDEYITSENVEKGDIIYEKVLSKINSKSDISYIEASKALQMLKLLCESDKRQPAKVVIEE